MIFPMRLAVQASEINVLVTSFRRSGSQGEEKPIGRLRSPG